MDATLSCAPYSDDHSVGLSKEVLMSSHSFIVNRDPRAVQRPSPVCPHRTTLSLRRLPRSGKRGIGQTVQIKNPSISISLRNFSVAGSAILCLPSRTLSSDSKLGPTSGRGGCTHRCMHPTQKREGRALSWRVGAHYIGIQQSIIVGQ